METTMAKGKPPPQEMSRMISQNLQQARGAMQNYLNFLQASLSASPWANTELNKKLAGYAQRNVDTAFQIAQQLTEARDLQDLVRIQTEYFQAQLKALTEQAKDLGETATKAATTALKGPLKPSS
jgi:hypothetical protein